MLMGVSDYCDICGKPTKIHVSGTKSGEFENYCLNCHNKIMAELTSSVLPEKIPQRLLFIGGDGTASTIEIEFMIFPHCKTLTATEVGELKHRAEVFGELDDDFGEMWEKLVSQIDKVLSTKYIQPDGHFVGCKAVGYVEWNRERNACDVIIDGKPYTWAELESNLSAHEGFKIKIEFGDIDDELD